MLRSILIFVYIAAVLLVSGLAQAASPAGVAAKTDLALVEDVQFNADSYEMYVRGAFMNGCQKAPKAVVLSTTGTDEDVETVVMGVKVESEPGQLCSQAIQGRYDLVFDVRSVGLPAHKDLVVKFKNFSAITGTPIAIRIDDKLSDELNEETDDLDKLFEDSISDSDLKNED